MDCLRGNGLAAFGADQNRIEHLLTRLMFMQHRATACIHHMGVAPVHDRHDDRVKVEAPLSQDVLVALRRVLIRGPFAERGTAPTS